MHQTHRVPLTAPPIAEALPIDAQTLTMTVTGNFHVMHERDARDRCGPRGATRQFDYTVTLTSVPAMLDDDGFLMDWQVVHRYFPERFGKVGHFPSCEQIAAIAVREIGNLCGGRVFGVTVKVGFHNGPAELEATWQAPDGWWQPLIERKEYGLPDKGFDPPHGLVPEHESAPGRGHSK